MSNFDPNHSKSSNSSELTAEELAAIRERLQIPADTVAKVSLSLAVAEMEIERCGLRIEEQGE